MNPAVDSFVQEAQDILEGLESSLLELEADPGSSDTVDAVFRALHTLKGSGAMFGFATLAGFVHHFENAYDRIREGEAAVTGELIALSLASRDHLARLVADGPDEGGAPIDDPETAKLVERIQALLDGGAPAAAPAADEAPAAPSAEAVERWAVSFRPAPGAMRHGMRPDLLLGELASLGEAEIVCAADDVPDLRALDPAECHLAWRVTLETTAGRDAIEEVFIFASDGDLEIERLEAPAPAAEPVPAPEAEPATPAETAAGAGSAAPKPPAGGEAGAPQQAAKQGSSVRVQSERLDELMDQLGELVIAQARLNRISEQLGDAQLSGTAEEIERLVTGLRDATLSIRMLPIELVFGKFRRVVRDLSGELGKRVHFESRGGETEVDKNVIDSLTEPLVHIVRNAIDHGVEAPEARVAAGKPEQATVVMSARQSGGEVLISLSDDGAGLDAAAIRRRAVERGLLAADAEPTDEQLHQLIFEPGFSTAQTLSSVSGRGVGMDAVRRVIDDLRGSVDVRSRKGQGTEVTLRLPLTLAIIDGLLVEVGGAPFVIPLSAVEECVELPVSELGRQSGRSILRIRDQLVPFVGLDAQFGFPPSEASTRRVAIVAVEGRRMGLVVDDVVGQHQTVVKPLSPYHRGVEGLAGGTILGDGSVALILDVAALVRRAQAQPRLAA